MNNYLISIRKPFTDLIFHLDELDPVKTNEWRKKPLPIGHYFVYESKHGRGCGKVVGEFDIVANHAFPIDSISFEDCQAHDLVSRGIVAYGFLKNYANGRAIIYANIIENANHYDTPRELSEFSYVCESAATCGKCKHARYEYRDNGIFYTDVFVGCNKQIKRPPQSWCRVEGER